MISKFKKYILVMLSALLVVSLSGCGKNTKEAQYKSYVKSLIAINYLGATDDYIKSAGCNKEDAIALYNANIDVLTDSILTYYGATLPEDSNLREDYEELAKKIYSKINYSVSDAYKEDETYNIDVEIKPIDIFEQTKAEVTLYIDSFNVRVANGEFNEYTVDMYNEEFARGLVNILDNACNEMTYANTVVVTVSIIESGNSFYISDADFLSIDAAMLSVATPISDDSDSTSEEE